MSAAGRNLFKVVAGLAIGAAVGVLVAREVGPVTGQEVPPEEDEFGLLGVSTEPRESIRERWDRALAAGEAAREAKEAELRDYFRQKVGDPSAFNSDRTGQAPPAL